jgi:hypothetical protein
MTAKTNEDGSSDVRTEKETPNLNECEWMLVQSQSAVLASLNNAGDLILTQWNWPDEDAAIIIADDNIAEFIDRLIDVLAIL